LTQDANVVCALKLLINVKGSKCAIEMMSLLVVILLTLFGGGRNAAHESLSLCGVFLTMDSSRVAICNRSNDSVPLKGYYVSTRRSLDGDFVDQISDAIVVPPRTFVEVRMKFLDAAYTRLGSIRFRRYFLFAPNGELVSKLRIPLVGG
jgi:hypothetical protein